MFKCSSLTLLTYGYLTWEWHKPIRGFTHPLMYAAVYKVLALLNLDIPVLLVCGRPGEEGGGGGGGVRGRNGWEVRGGLG